MLSCSILFLQTPVVTYIGDGVILMLLPLTKANPLMPFKLLSSSLSRLVLNNAIGLDFSEVDDTTPPALSFLTRNDSMRHYLNKCTVAP